MTKKKSEPNPIEEAIGERAKTTKDIPPIVSSEQFKKLAKTQDEPSPQEMLNLEELNRQTEERLRDDPEETTTMETLATPTTPTLVSKPDLPSVTETSSLESPPQKEKPIDVFEKGIVEIAKETEKEKTMAESLRQKMNEAPTVAVVQEAAKEIKKDFEKVLATLPAEDVELTALRKYILEDGFVVATVAFHIVSLCAQPMTTPSTTTWDFADRAMIPEMVFALLNQPGYIEGIWPSLKIIMGSNAGNAAWTAGIATTIAFFDVIRTLPAIEELKNETI